MAKLPVDELVAELGTLYRIAEQELQEKVNLDLASGRLGSAAYRRAQLDEIRDRLDRLNQAALPTATSIVASSYAHGARAVEAALGLGEGAFAAGIHQEAVEVLADNLTNSLGNATLNIGRKVDDVYRRVGLATAAQGLIQGAARREVSEELLLNLANQGLGAFEDKAGRMWGLETYSTMVARTTTREAVSHGTANRVLEAGQDLVTISSHSHDEDVCSPYDGQTFSLTGETEGYPVLDELPPFHPNCVHVVTPAEANLDEALEALESAETLEDAEAAVGIGTELETPASLREAVQNVTSNGVTTPAPVSTGDPVLDALAAAEAGLDARVAARAAELGDERLPANGVDIADKAPLQSPNLIPERVMAGLQEVYAAIRSVHRVPEDAPEVPVVMGTPPRGARGAYISDMADETKRIEIQRFDDQRPSVLAHELGHYIDHKMLPGEFGFGSEANLPDALRGNPVYAELYRELLDAFQSSHAVRNLRSMREGSLLPMTDSGLVGQADNGVLDYLLGPDELFARAYRQWVAIRSGNSVLLHELRQDQDKRITRRLGYPDVWSDEDFEPIARALDELFGKRGLR